jgi:hypothetical protein
MIVVYESSETYSTDLENAINSGEPYTVIFVDTGVDIDLSWRRRQ